MVADRAIQGVVLTGSQAVSHKSFLWIGKDKAASEYWHSGESSEISTHSRHLAASASVREEQACALMPINDADQ